MQRSNIISGIIFAVLLVLGFYLWKGSPAELRYQSAAVADTQKPGAFTLQTPVVTCEGTLPRITLSWGESARASNYRVDRMYPWGGPWEEVGRTTTLSFTDMTFESGYDIGDFLYRVQARNTSGAIQTLSIPATVAPCSIAVVDALPPPPSAPTPLPIAPAPAPIVVPSPTPSPVPTPLPTPPPAPLPVVVPVPVPSPTLAPVPMQIPTPTPTPVPVVLQKQISLFSIGNRILTTANLNVRSTPSTYARKIGTQPKGVAGSIVGGPLSANGYIWWNVNFDSNADGWCIEKYYTLAPVGTPTPTPTPTTTPTPTPLPASPATPTSPTSTPIPPATSTPPTSVGTSSISTPPSSSSALLWGAYTGDTPSSLSAFETLVGKPVNMQAIFVGWGTDAPFPSEFGATLRDKGKTLVIFWEPTDGSGSLNQPNYNYNSINSGAWDSYMAKFAADAKAYGGPVILVPFHEMNGNWDPWDGTVNGNSPQSFIAAWKKVKGIFSSATNVKFAWDINNESVPDTAANRASVYWPGDAYVDYVGIDGFNFGSPWQTFSQMFDNAVSLVTPYNKPIYIFSIASADGAQKPAWITDALSVQIKKIPNIKGWIWFNVNKEQNWLVNSSAASLTAFKAVLP